MPDSANKELPFQAKCSGFETVSYGRAFYREWLWFFTTGSFAILYNPFCNTFGDCILVFVV
ncbi:MAG: hypothetical protein JXN60_02860, partial [Lentisphaerae bacterium]|nr:hypothetical protein [Lentisphaerota bacterium]